MLLFIISALIFLWTDVMLKGRPSPRLCQIKLILQSLINAGKHKTADCSSNIPPPSLLFRTYHIGHQCFPLLSFLSFLSILYIWWNWRSVKINSGSLSIILRVYVPHKNCRMPCGDGGIISLSYNVCLEIALLISWHIATYSSYFHSHGDHHCACVIFKALSVHNE